MLFLLQESPEQSPVYKNLTNCLTTKSGKKNSVFKDVLFEEEDNRCTPNNILSNALDDSTKVNMDTESRKLPDLIYIIEDGSDTEEIVYFKVFKTNLNKVFLAYALIIL